MRLMPGRQRQAQSGVVLMLMVLLLFVGASSFYLGVANSFSRTMENQAAVMSELAEVKDELLAYATHYADYYATGPGRLPCPDTDNDSLPEAACTPAVADFQGRLPESLVLPGADASPFGFTSHNQGVNQQFWYAVDPSFYVSAALVNSGIPGNFTIDGTGNYVAVIIAPGNEVGVQNRIASNDADDFIEGGNQNGSNYITSFVADPDNFNDRILGITQTELMVPVSARVVKMIADQLNIYHLTARNSRPPGSGAAFTLVNSYPAETEDPPGTILSEQQMYAGTAMAGAPAWYSNDGWDTVTGYTYVSADVAQISVTLPACIILYTIDFNNGISRDVSGC